MQEQSSCFLGIFGTRTRFFILPLVLLCLSFIWANILSFNLVTVCINNEAAASNSSQLTISQTQTTYSIAAMAVGALAGNFPAVYFVNRYGSRVVFTLLGLLTSVATVALPPAINKGFGWLIVCRVLQGVAYAAIFPVIGAFTAKWTYHKQSGLFVSVLVSYVQIAPIFSNAVGGVLCDSLGWPSIFYVHGGISCALFIIYFLVFRSAPEDHPCVSYAEGNKIARGKPKIIDTEVPYLEILKTPCIWAIWVAALGNAVISNIFFVFTPIYMSKALHFSTSKSGINAMYPPLAQLVTKITTGLISDKIKFLSNRWKFRIFNSFSFFGSALVSVALAFMEDSHPSANSPVMAVTLAILGTNTGGFYKAAPFLSKQYSSFVTGMISQCNCLILLVIPFIVQAITPNETVGEWKIVFLLIAGTLVVTNIVFVIFIQGTPFEWTGEPAEVSSILQYDHMVTRLSRRCFTVVCCCCLTSLFLILYGHGNLTTDHVDNVLLLFDSRSKKLLERNASGSWPNYKYIWEDYYGQIPAIYNCKEFAAGNAKAITHYSFLGRIPLKQEPSLTMECDHIRRRVMGNTVYKRVKHPYAVARNVFADYYLQELLLAFSYSPFNMYCYAIDKKSQKSFKKELKVLGSCLPNVVVIDKEYDFDSGGHFQDEAHHDCTNEMLQFKGWDYVMFLQNADIFIKAPEEISEIIHVLNGTAMTGFSKPFKDRIPKSNSWTPKDLSLFKNPSQFTKEQFLTPLQLRKSPNHMFLPREFVDAVQEKLNLKKLFSLFQSKKYGVDEMLYATLLSAHFLKLPGQVENNCSVTDNFRYVHWNFGDPLKCQSFKKRHGVCLIGMEYIRILKDKPQIVANKIWPEWDFGAIMCMGEVLYNRTNSLPAKIFNLSPYQKIPQVREHILKSQGKFNVSAFTC